MVPLHDVSPVYIQAALGATPLFMAVEKHLDKGQAGTGQHFSVKVPVHVHPSWRQHSGLKVCAAFNISQDSKIAPFSFNKVAHPADLLKNVFDFINGPLDPELLPS